MEEGRKWESKGKEDERKSGMDEKEEEEEKEGRRKKVRSE